MPLFPGDSFPIRVHRLAARVIVGPAEATPEDGPSLRVPPYLNATFGPKLRQKVFKFFPWPLEHRGIPEGAPRHAYNLAGGAAENRSKSGERSVTQPEIGG